MLPLIDYNALLHSTMDCLPELILCLGIAFLLLLPIFRLTGRSHQGRLALLIVAIALGVTILQWNGLAGLKRLLGQMDLDYQSDFGQLVLGMHLRPPAPYGAIRLFGDMLVYDLLTVYMRLFVLVTAGLVIWLTLVTNNPERDDSCDFYCLLLGGCVGMMLMASAAHLLMVYIAVEMASLPCYALAGFNKDRRASGESALKYVVYGGGSAGVMLYGISLLSGHFGTGYIPEIAVGLGAAVAQQSQSGYFPPGLILGILFLLVGIAFKLAAVPFHFWCPDVFEGASAEVAGFLSVASKGAALALLARISLIFGGLDPEVFTADRMGLGPFATIRHSFLLGLAVIAVLTVTFGNLAAFRQTNLKRLLAYSTIAHAGYMLMALATMTRQGVDSMLFYLVAYLFTNLAAFAIVAFIRCNSGSEDLRDLRGQVRRTPALVACLAVVLLSLAGLPPLAGFAAKFQVFTTLFGDANHYYRADEAILARVLIALVVIALVNTVMSAFYYINILKVLVLDQRVEDIEDQPAESIPEPPSQIIYAGLMTLAILFLGVFWGPLDANSRRCVYRFYPGTGIVLPTPPAAEGKAPMMVPPPPDRPALQQPVKKRDGD